MPWGSRGAQDPRRIESVDGLRALAFLLVFAFHTWEFAGSPYVPVVSAVVSQNTRPDFFVVLTGFVLFLPFARDRSRAEKFQPGPYVRRRLRRIVLPYWAALALAILLPQALVVMVRVLGVDASWQPMPTWGDVLSHVTFTHLFFADYWAGINGSLWTMSLEMQLYLLFPLLILAWRRFGRTGLVWALGLALLYRVVLGLLVAGDGFPAEFLVGATGVGRLMEFLAGMGAALLMFRWRYRLTPGLVVALAVAVVGGYWVAVQGWPTWLAVRELGLSMTFGALIVAAVTARQVERVFAWRPMSWLGYRAYSMFLVHQPVAWFFSEFLAKMLGVGDGTIKLAALWSAGLVVVMAFGQVMFVLAEKPCIAWAKRSPGMSSSGRDAREGAARPATSG